MADQDLRERILERAELAGLVVSDSLADDLRAYLELLFRWNKTVNLTALTPFDAIDRLLLEPVAATRLVPIAECSLLDLGSGGGSPAIPLKLAWPASALTMVEVKERKSAFLREAIRSLRLSSTTVETSRYEDLLSRPASRAAYDAVSIRALRTGRDTLPSIADFLKPGGSMLLFHRREADVMAGTGRKLRDMAEVTTFPLISLTNSALTLVSLNAGVRP